MQIHIFMNAVQEVEPKQTSKIYFEYSCTFNTLFRLSIFQINM